jgi:hypothetical protein
MGSCWDKLQCCAHISVTYSKDIFEAQYMASSCGCNSENGEELSLSYNAGQKRIFQN